jgi:hypothetical protein
LALVGFDPNLARLETIPTVQCRSESDFAPFWVARQLAKGGGPREKRFDESLHTSAAVGILWPIVSDKNGPNSDRVDRLPGQIIFG